MKIHELLEARKNPELNPKISINAELKDYAAKYHENGFISFTSVDKLGINPRSDFSTPVGIYAYPVMYTYEKLGDQHSAHRLPFAGKNEYATLFTATNGVVDLHKFSAADLAEVIKKLTLVYKKEDVDEAISWATEHGRVQTAGGKLWSITMRISALLPDDKVFSPAIWNKVFRTIGINGCVDSAGEKIIHPHEPTQAVFFKKPGVIENEKRVYNKYAPREIERQRLKGASKHQANIDGTNLKSRVN